VIMHPLNGDASLVVLHNIDVSILYSVSLVDALS
jgi:hypothetical protein